MGEQRVWLVRHGETEWSRSGRHTGVTDLDLTPAGEQVARGLGERLDPAAYALVLTSPLLRARRTADLAGFADAVLDERLREWEYGAYEGLTTPQIREQVPGWELWSHPAAEGGESVADVEARITDVIERVRGADGDALLFAHGHSLAAFTACWLGLGVARCGHFRLRTGTVSVLTSHRETPTIERWNT